MKNKKLTNEDKQCQDNINALFTSKEQKKKFIKFYDTIIKELGSAGLYYSTTEEGYKCFAILVYLKFMKLERLEVETRLHEAGYYGG